MLHSMRATCYVHLILLHLIILTILGEEYESRVPVISSLVGTNILLSTQFSDTLSLSSSLIVREKLSHPYKKK
jgi:hypothetical protein